MNDFESDLAQRINATIDTELGPRRPAPPLDLPDRGRTGRRHRPVWLLPLTAAAAVAAVAVGITASVTLADKHNAPPATVPPTTTPSVPTSTPTSIPQSPDQTLTSAAPVVATHTVVVSFVGRTTQVVTLTVPTTWQLSRTQPHSCCNVPPTRCLVSGRADWANDPDNCVLTVTMGGLNGGFGLSPDLPEPAPDPSCRKWTTTQESDPSIQGRPGEYRAFLNGCTNTASEMWTVMSRPQLAFWHPITGQSTHATATAVMASLGLPPVTSSARQFDEGLLRTMTRSSAGYRITLDRVVDNLDGTLTNLSPVTYDYDITFGIAESGGWRFENLDQVFAQFSKGPHPTDGTPALADNYVRVYDTGSGYQLALFAPINLDA